MEKMWLALQATAFPCFCTTAGAASVFLVRGSRSWVCGGIMEGFAGGVMLAASIFSLLLPAVQGSAGWQAPTIGFTAGALLLLAAEWAAEGFLQPRGGQGARRSRRVALGIALHNLPEGMVVGMAAVLAVGGDPELKAGAVALSLGIGLQNLPEGAAVSLPLHQAGQSRPRAFMAGLGSGLVEPLGGVMAALLAVWVRRLMPWLLAGAAGVMVGITVQDLIPESAQRRQGMIAFLGGFALMMAMDIAL